MGAFCIPLTQGGLYVYMALNQLMYAMIDRSEFIKENLVDEVTFEDYTGQEKTVRLGQPLICKRVRPFQNTDEAPPLVADGEVELKRITLDKEGNPHFDIGLVSELNYVSSQETKEYLPGSWRGGTHWCHPSRFIVKE
jgi:hypothetical protein